MKKCKLTDETMKQRIKEQIMERAKAQIETAEHDYQKGIEDCKMGVYDKWFRYHRWDDGNAYDKGWAFQNQTTQCETVSFLPGI